MLRMKTHVLVLAVKFIQHGAHINAVDQNGTTPLYLAVRSNHVDMVKLFLEQPDITLDVVRSKEGLTVKDLISLSPYVYKAFGGLLHNATHQQKSFTNNKQQRNVLSIEIQDRL